MSAIPGSLLRAVLVSDSIPAHDQTLDLAEEIADRLQALHTYVAEVRDPQQANAALLDLAAAISSIVYDVTR